MKRSISVNKKCLLAQNCKVICPDEAIFTHENSSFVDPSICTLCEVCLMLCPNDALEVKLDND